MAAKKSKLDEQFQLEAPREKQKQGTSSSIFSGVAVYVNGYTGKRFQFCTGGLSMTGALHDVWFLISQ